MKTMKLILACLVLTSATAFANLLLCPPMVTCTGKSLATCTVNGGSAVTWKLYGVSDSYGPDEYILYAAGYAHLIGAGPECVYIAADGSGILAYITESGYRPRSCPGSLWHTAPEAAWCATDINTTHPITPVLCPFMNSN